MKIPFEKLNDPKFLDAIDKMASKSYDDEKINYSVSRLNSAVQTESKKLTKQQIEIHKKFGMKDANGEVVYRNINGQLIPHFPSTKVQTAAERAFSDLVKGKTFTVKINPLPSKVAKGLTPVELTPLIDLDLIEGLTD